MTTTLRAPDPHARSPRPRPVVLLDGTGALLNPLAELLSRSGHEVRAGAAELVAADHALRDGAHGAPRLVIVVAARALSPTRASAWRGLVAHLPVVYDERTVMIGPVVAAGPPCLHCLDLHRHDHDPSWPARRGGLLAAGGDPAPDAALATAGSCSPGGCRCPGSGSTTWRWSSARTTSWSPCTARSTFWRPHRRYVAVSSCRRACTRGSS